ncbi:hypothetical protein GCM10011414_23120 [Croceivirga lutea]|nr:hypothetical protein GCM10011414_23120 [Croceivirga lutea]
MIFWLPKAKTSWLNWKISCFLCFTLTVSFSQQNPTKIVNGRVDAAGEDVTGIAVQNISSEKAAITNFEGKFSIEVAVGDTLVFSAVQLRRKTLPVSKEIYQLSFVIVPMQPFVNELREVVVQPYNLTGNLGTDMQQLNVKPVTAESLGLPNAEAKIPTQSERQLQEAATGMYTLRNPLRVGLNPIINAISGRTKMLKKRVALEKKSAQTLAVQNAIIDSLFLAELKIPKDRINDFMYYCEVDQQFQSLVRLEDELKLWEFLMYKSKLYRENNGLD